MNTRIYTKTGRAESEAQTRTALLDAATRLFFEGELGTTSLQAVAAEAGVTKQTLLRHFGSKDGLIRAGFERACEQIAAQRAHAPAGDLEGIVENLIEHYEQAGDRAIRLEAADVGGDIAGEFVRAGRSLHYAWVDRAFRPWLDRLEADQRRVHRAALIAVCDVHTWRLLNDHLRLGRSDVKAALIATLRGLIGEEET